MSYQYSSNIYLRKRQSGCDELLTGSLGSETTLSVKCSSLADILLGRISANEEQLTFNPLLKFLYFFMFSNHSIIMCLTCYVKMK